MPEVQRSLVERGVTFSESFTTSSLCCPSRASILTGQYPHTTGVYRQALPYGGFKSFDDTTTIATVLRSGGYRTGFFGKYLDSYQSDALAGYVPPGWNRWVAFVHSEYLEYGLTIDGTVHRYGIDAEDYSTDVLAAETEAFIRGSDGPVFAVYAPPAPHDPAIPAAEDEGLFADLPPWRPPSFNEPDVSDKPAHVQAMIPLGPDRTSHQDALRIDQYRTLQAVDRAVGSTARRARGHGATRRRAGDLHLGQRPALGRAPLGEEGGPVRGGDPCPPRDPRRADRVRGGPGGPASRVEHRSRADDRGGGRPAAPGRGRAQSASAPRRPARRLASRPADRASARDQPDPHVLRGPDVAVPVRVLRHGRAWSSTTSRRIRIELENLAGSAPVEQARLEGVLERLCDPLPPGFHLQIGLAATLLATAVVLASAVAARTFVSRTARPRRVA